MKIGPAIRVARAMRGFSQKKLAETARLDASYISLLEKDRRVPTAATLESIAKALKIPLHLIIMLASEDKDLFGISQDEAQELGHRLMNLFVHR
jgi:transcriptional regulator with XRE-family HTH domain